MPNSIVWLTCGECGIGSTDETIDYFSSECMCCHRDFCTDCCDVILKEKTTRCSQCVADCNKKCHYGCDCCCSDYGEDDEEFCEKHEQVMYNKDGLKCSGCLEFEKREKIFKKMFMS